MMDFGRYLYLTRRLTRAEYVALLTAELNDTLSNARVNPATGFVTTDVARMTDLESVREWPFGDVLSRRQDIARRVFDRAKKNLGELVDEWQEWHRDELEPICVYSLTSRLGRHLYRNQIEKKLVAHHLVRGKVRQGGATTILDNDTVAILEGASGLYVGLAIAGARKDVNIYTSNSGLIREYRDNPAVARGLGAFHVIGGLADFDRKLRRSEHCGVYGKTCLEQFTEAIAADPPATIVVMPVSGLRPDVGPVVRGPAADLRPAILKAALERPVREVVFIADYVKHLPASADPAGLPICDTVGWPQIVRDHPERISVVTAPPPALRAAMSSQDASDILTRKLADLRPPPPFAFGGDDENYDLAAKRLYEQLSVDPTTGQKWRPMFHEACSTPVQRLVFTVDCPREEFDQDGFEEALRLLVENPHVEAQLDDFHVTFRRHDIRTEVRVEGVADLVEKILVLCDNESNTIDDFLAATRTATIEGSLYGEPRKFKSAQARVDG